MQVCLSAAVTLAAAAGLIRGIMGPILPRRLTAFLSAALPRAILAVIAVLSLSRTAALLVNYSAPMYVYRQLPAVQVTGCTLAVPRRPFLVSGVVYGIKFVTSIVACWYFKCHPYSCVESVMENDALQQS
jgi:hypothetical protein